MGSEAIGRFFDHWLELCDQLSATEAEMLDEARAELAALLAENKEQAARIAEMEEARVAIDTWGLAILEKLGDFMRQALADGPLTTCIEAKIGDGGESIPVLWLWVSVDEKDPVARIREVAAERDRLKGIVESALATAPSGIVAVERARLKEIEWQPDYDVADGIGLVRTEGICPVCDHPQSKGHAGDCWLSAAIGEDR